MSMVEFNQGYKIVAAEAYQTDSDGRVHRIVLGQLESSVGALWVTWDSVFDNATGIKGADYFWGHYFDREKAARADYHRRLVEKYDV